MDFATARAHMVDSQLKTNRIIDTRLLEAFETIPRERFVPEDRQVIAYIDEDLSLGGGRYLMEPMVLGRLIQEAVVLQGDLVLDVGCATGYSSAILARLATTVVALEEDSELAGRASKTLEEIGVDNAVSVQGELRRGYPKQAPYNVILFGGAVADVPRDVMEQLADGGRLVTVKRDNERAMGRAVLVTRIGEVFSTRVLFDAATPYLPGFQPEPGFVF